MGCARAWSDALWATEREPGSGFTENAGYNAALAVAKVILRVANAVLQRTKSGVRSLSLFFRQALETDPPKLPARRSEAELRQ